MKRKLVFPVTAAVLIGAILLNFIYFGIQCYSATSLGEAAAQEEKSENQDFIKWVDFNVPYAAMEKALQIDIDAHAQGIERDWVDLLAYLGAKYGGEWKQYKNSHLDELTVKLNEGETIDSLTSNMKYFPYYQEAYDAVLGGMVGEWQLAKEEDEEGNPIYEDYYGLKAYSPIAYSFSFSHYDDFGNSRSFGYKRRHLGNDLLGSIGTPIIAVESGTVEALGWNRYGGWRIGIRSLNGKRYYYYAHLRKGHPFQTGLKEGDTVKAGDVIGYLGMTGYSDQEDVNGMTKPHLHFGMQLIFDESQKEGDGEIWIDVYQIVKLLKKHCSVVERAEERKEYERKYQMIDPVLEEENTENVEKTS